MTIKFFKFFIRKLGLNSKIKFFQISLIILLINFHFIPSYLAIIFNYDFVIWQYKDISSNVTVFFIMLFTRFISYLRTVQRLTYKLPVINLHMQLFLLYSNQFEIIRTNHLHSFNPSCSRFYISYGFCNKHTGW